jgi:hypothetical protein
VCRARDDGAFDGNSSSIIKLNTNSVLYMREVNRHLALVCILREDSFERQGILFIIYLIYHLYVLYYPIIGKMQKVAPCEAPASALGIELETKGLSKLLSYLGSMLLLYSKSLFVPW